jgi:phosphohistidine phosphatase SixA
MIVGHLPHLAKLAAKIQGQRAFEDMVNFCTSSIVALSSEDGRKWEMQWMLSPKML